MTRSDPVAHSAVPEVSLLAYKAVKVGDVPVGKRILNGIPDFSSTIDDRPVADLAEEAFTQAIIDSLASDIQELNICFFDIVNVGTQRGMDTVGKRVVRFYTEAEGSTSSYTGNPDTYRIDLDDRIAKFEHMESALAEFDENNTGSLTIKTMREVLSRRSGGANPVLSKEDVEELLMHFEAEFQESEEADSELPIEELAMAFCEANFNVESTATESESVGQKAAPPGTAARLGHREGLSTPPLKMGGNSSPAEPAPTPPSAPTVVVDAWNWLSQRGSPSKT